VPPLVIQYLPNFGPWADIVPILQNNIENAIDHPVELQPKDLSGFVADVYNDRRTYHYSTWGNPPAATQLDPGNYMRRQAIDRAGAGGDPNLASYANCEYSQRVILQSATGDPEERNEKLWEAMELYSQDRVSVPLIPRSNYSAIRTDRVDPGGVGEMGPYQYNPNFFVETTPQEGDRWIWTSQDSWLPTMNHLTMDGQSQIGFWATIIYGGLLTYNNQWELETELAADWSQENQSQRYTFELADAAFSDGSQITSEDVKFSMELIEEASVPLAVEQNYASIETPDDQTIIFEFDNPNPQFPTGHLPLWGVMPKSQWEGIDDVMNHEPDPNTYVSSGPFQVVDYSRGESMVVEPNPGHPKYSPDHSIVFQKVAEKSTRLRNFREGDTGVVSNLTGNDIANLQNQVGEDITEPGITSGIGPWHLMSSFPQAPVRFNAFNDAVGASINRQQINNVVFSGFARPITHALPWTDAHPTYPDLEEYDIHKYTESATGEPDRAQQILEDAGWGWDDNGNLRYPEGTDTAPLWPQGERPNPDDFPCINAEGEFVGTES
jgi:peptide/nickel transport system substrate-binding protein